MALPDIKNIIFGIKNLLDDLNRRLDTSEDKNQWIKKESNRNYQIESQKVKSKGPQWPVEMSGLTHVVDVSDGGGWAERHEK